MVLTKFDDKKIVGTANVQLKISEKEFNYIVVGALEGGIGYWACLDNTTADFKEKPSDVATSEWVSKLLLDGKSVTFFDNENEDEDEKWELTLDKVIRGIELNHLNRHWDCSLDNADATTYDCIIQYALFDKVVFG